MEKSITIKLTQQEVQYLLNMLGQRPIAEALGVFNSVMQQANQQIAESAGASGSVGGPSA